MSQLSERRCSACTGKTPKIEREQAQALLAEVPGFTLEDDARRIRRSFEFKDFHQTMAFVNAVAWIAHREDHHPDLAVSYNSCSVSYSTHAVLGLSENDFICAAKVNALL